MYITADDIKHEVSLYYRINNRNGNKKVGLIRAYFVYSFYNVEKDEKIHLNPIPHGRGADSALLQIVFFITSLRMQQNHEIR